MLLQLSRLPANPKEHLKGAGGPRNGAVLPYLFEEQDPAHAEKGALSALYPDMALDGVASGLAWYFSVLGLVEGGEYPVRSLGGYAPAVVGHREPVPFVNALHFQAHKRGRVLEGVADDIVQRPLELFAVSEKLARHRTFMGKAGAHARALA